MCGILGACGIGSFALSVILRLGMHPKVSSATNIYMTFFGAASRTLVYLNLGAIDIPYASLLSVCGILGTVIGLTLLKRLLAKFERPSIIVFVLALCLGVSTIIVPIFDIKHMMAQVKEDISVTSFGTICPKVTTL